MSDAEALARKKRRHRNERIAATVLVLTLAAGVAAFLRWNADEEQEFRNERTYLPGRTEITPDITLLQQYVRLDTSAGNEMIGAQWLAGVLRRHGVASEVIESAPGRGNVYARIRGKARGGGLLLLHHIDVVPPGEEPWKQPPFSGNIHLNMLYGRGALDVKSTGIAHLRAFIDVARSGRIPEHDLVFLATADEEQGGGLGMQWLIANRPDVLADVEYALNEGGLNEVQAGKLIYFGIEIGAKHFGELTLEAPTRAQLEQARIALEPLFPSFDAEVVVPEVARFFRDIAPTRLRYRHLLADIDGTVARGKFWELPTSYREFAQDVIFVDGARSENGRHTARVVLANIPGHDLGPDIARVETIAARHGARVAAIRHRDETIAVTPPDTPLFRLLATRASETYGCRAGTLLLFRSTNDSRFLRQRGIKAYGFLPFPVDYFQSLSIHGKDERIRLDWFLQGVDLTGRVVREYAFGQQ